MASDTLYVFGDQSLDLLPSIRKLSKKCRQLAPLHEFMRAATDNIQYAMSTVPAHMRPNISPFDTPLQLAEVIKNEAGSTPLVSALLAVTQLGECIVHLSANPCALDGTQSLPTFLGICMGSLPAAALASSRNLTELLQVAPHIVSLAFYIGLEAFRRSQCLDNSNESWATVLKDVDPSDFQTKIDAFNQTLEDRSHKRVYISAIGESSVTVSGPPSTTQRFFTETLSLKKSKRLQLPIRAAFHARHLIPILHTRIFDHVDTRYFRRRLRHHIISPCSGGYYHSSELMTTLGEIIDEILQQPINWQAAVKYLPSLLTPTAKAITLGPFAATAALSRWLCPQLDTETGGLSDPSSPPREGSGAVAIVGMSVRAPGSETLEEFWNVLRDGKDLHEEIPADRFDISTHCDPSGRTKNATLTPYGVFIDRPGYFDPRFFNMSPREAFQTDPQQRLMLLTTYEALENAGYSPNRTPSSNTRRIASFIGQTGDDYREFNANQNVDTYFITGNIRAFGPGRLNYHFGWEGPSFSVDTACSSSGASIQLACSALLSRECDTAVSGGANLLTSPDLFAGLSRGGFLSKTGGCKTFDRDADGYVRGEACGVVILKRLEDAIMDRDNILAVIRGATTNHSAEAVSITHPHEKTQERLFRTVLNDAGVLPHEVDLAEIHGTGTQAGDAVESRSVTNVLCEGRKPENPLILSTIKPNIGHGEAASGVTSIIKAILMMQKNAVPPHIGIKGLINDKLPPLRDLHACVCSKEKPFFARRNGDGKRRILVNNFDAAGGNTSMLLEDPPQLSLTGEDIRSHKVVTFSAKSSSALSNNMRNVLRRINTSPDMRLEDLAYTTTSRRIHHPVRKAFAVTSMKELVGNLEKQSSSEPARRSNGSHNAIFCFTGQGSQYVSMASVLYKTHPIFRDCIYDYASICSSYGFPSFLPIIEGDATTFTSPVCTQLSIVAVELALAFLWKSWGVEASAVIGHSLGEYAALCYAGVISPSDCLYLVGKRAELIAEKCTPDTHAMLAVQAPSEMVQSHLSDLPLYETEFACFNSPRSTVISGPIKEISTLSDRLGSKGLNTKMLLTRHAFHSSQLNPVLEQFESIAQTISYAKPEIPIASTLLGDVVTTDGVFGPRYLRSQTRNSVRFQDAVEALYSASVASEATMWFEMGPGSACLSMVKAIKPGVRATLPSLQSSRSDWQTLSSSIASAYSAGLSVDWVEFHRPFEQGLQLIQLPNYSFDLKNYWMYDGHSHNSNQSQWASQSKRGSAQSVPFAPTSGLHRIVKDESDTQRLRLTFAADACDPAFNKVLRGHQVNGIALCPSSVYADMAVAAASYIRSLSKSDLEPVIDVKAMEVTKPLVVNPGDTKQVILVTATKNHSASEINLQYSCQDGANHQNHATCIARFVSNNVSTFECSKNAYLVRSRVDWLQKAASEGKAHKILRPLVYKLFKNFVDYDTDYQGLEEVLLDTDMLEAAATVNFRTNEGGFACSPYWIDSIAHLSGFIVNGTEFTPEDSVFISHGWDSLKIWRTLSQSAKYQSYVRMRPNKRQTVLTGDIYLFEGDELAAICQGLKFQQVKRNILDFILPTSKATSVVPAMHGQNSTSSLALSEPLVVAAVHSTPCETTERELRRPTFELILRIIADALGSAVSDLDEEAEFVSLGIDSLMIANIVGMLQAHSAAHFPATLFAECCSIKELRIRWGSTPETLTASSHVWPKRSTTNDECHSGAPTADVVLAISFARILHTIAHELGIDVSELEDNVQFVDVGVDSLFALSVLSSLSKLVNEQLPASLFMQYPTVADLRTYFQSSRSCQQPENVESEHHDTSCTNDESLGQITPATEYDDGNVESCLAKKSIETEILRKIVAEEVGISTTEIEDEALLAELGVDSLLALCILTRFNEQAGMTLASSFLSENSTFVAIERALRDTSVSSPAAMQATKESPAPLCLPSPTLPPLCLSPTAAPVTYEVDTNIRSASSILLQGSPSCREPCMFLIPDGSGSPSSYVGLPHLDHTGAVYGLNSPFLDDPDLFNMSLQDVVTLYVAEMRRIQPRGPYHIGGWSAGGICAFEAATQLIRSHGEEISTLILIDAPCPTILPPLPIEDVDFLQSIGVFEALRPRAKIDRGAPATSTAPGLRDGVREHFVGTLNALELYDPQPIDDSKVPRSVIILWARRGVWETLGEEIGLSRACAWKNHKHPTTSWLMDTRPSYGTCGWEELLPGSNFTCRTIQGDHFSIMRKPGVQEMGAMISSALTRA